jgi:hypothetical protein
MVFTSAGDEMFPTVIVGTRASCRIRSLNGV